MKRLVFRPDGRRSRPPGGIPDNASRDTLVSAPKRRAGSRHDRQRMSVDVVAPHLVQQCNILHLKFLPDFSTESSTTNAFTTNSFT